MKNRQLLNLSILFFVSTVLVFEVQAQLATGLNNHVRGVVKEVAWEPFALEGEELVKLPKEKQKWSVTFDGSIVYRLSYHEKMPLSLDGCDLVIEPDENELPLKSLSIKFKSGINIRTIFEAKFIKAENCPPLGKLIQQTAEDSLKK